MGQWGDSEIKVGKARFLRHYTTKDCFGAAKEGDPVTYITIDNGGDPVAAEAALARLKAGGSVMDWKPAAEVQPVADRLYLGKGNDGKIVLVAWEDVADDMRGWWELLAGRSYFFLGTEYIVEVADTGEAWPD